MRRFREAYIGAIFTFFGRKYSVHAHEADAVVLTDTEHSLRTDPSFFHGTDANSCFSMELPMMTLKCTMVF